MKYNLPENKKMSLLCDCPLPAALTALTAVTCKTKFDQIVRMGIQRVSTTTPFNGGLGDDIEVEADWTSRMALADSDKIIITPFFTSLVFPVSESILSGGGDNTTVNGLPEYQGESNVAVEGVFKDLPDVQVQELDDLACESLAQDGEASIWVYFFNRFGKIIHGLTFQGIPVYNFRISSLGSEGLNASNMHSFRFDLVNTPKAWDRDSVLATPAFDPLTL